MGMVNFEYQKRRDLKVKLQALAIEFHRLLGEERVLGEHSAYATKLFELEKERPDGVRQPRYSELGNQMDELKNASVNKRARIEHVRNEAVFIARDLVFEATGEYREELKMLYRRIMREDFNFCDYQTNEKWGLAPCSG